MRRFLQNRPIIAVLLTFLSLTLWWLTSGEKGYRAYTLVAALERGDMEAVHSDLWRAPDWYTVLAHLDRLGSPQLYQRALDDPGYGWDWEVKRSLVERGAKPDYRHLNYATKNGDTDLALFLLEKGVSARPPQGQGNPLSDAIATENEHLIRVFIEHRADVNADSSTPEFPYGYRPLEAAAAFQNVATVRLLLKLGADPTLFSGSKETPSVPIWKEMRSLARSARADLSWPREPILIWNIIKPQVEKRLGHPVED